MKNIKDMVVDLIIENDLQDIFFKILQDIIKGKMNRDIDELYNNGFWDFTYDLGFNCDTRENEKMFEAIYNQLWEIAEKVFGE
jgi:hypothetical protein